MYILRVPLWHSRLSKWHCHCSSSGHCCGTGLISGRELSHAACVAKKKENFKIPFTTVLKNMEIFRINLPKYVLDCI